MKSKATVKGSTLVEVLIAMILIIVVFGIAMMIFTNVTSSSLSVKKIRAAAVLHDAMLSAEQSKDPITQTITVDDIAIGEEVKPYNGNPALLYMHFTAYDNNQQKVAELEKVILNNN
jgi:Tfp pilus assembly protein PilV